MKTYYLYFVKFVGRNDHSDTIVFLVTACEDAGAEAAGRRNINPDYVDNYDLAQCDVVCTTTDTVLCFEPV